MSIQGQETNELVQNAGTGKAGTTKKNKPRVLRVPPPETIPVHVGEERTVVQHSYNEFASHDIDAKEVVLVKRETGEQKKPIEVSIPSLPKLVGKLSVSTNNNAEPDQNEEEIYILQNRPENNNKKTQGSPEDDHLSVMPFPDFSEIPEDPVVDIPNKIPVSIIRLLTLLIVFTKHFSLALLMRFKGEEKAKAYGYQARKACEALGPTYIKFGQMVGSSPGLFPKVVSEEFLNCLDNAPVFAFDEVELTMTEAFGKEWRLNYKTFEEEPIASASIAQVHRAVMLDDSQVVVKIQRRGIKHIIEQDLGILFALAKFLVTRFKAAKLANPVGFVSDLNTTLHEEMNFILEANSMDKFNAVFSTCENHEVRAPRVNRKLTSEKVLTMEYLDGFRADAAEDIFAADINAEQAIRLAVKSFTRTLMLHGFFHGDVHAGNLQISKTSGVNFLDFGIVGRIDDEKRELLTHLIIAILTGSSNYLTRILIKLGNTPEHVDKEVLGQDLKYLLREFQKKTIAELDFGELLSEIITIGVRNQLGLPKEVILVIKQLVYFDRYSHLLAPDLDIFGDQFLTDFLWKDPIGRKLYPQMQMVGMINGVKSLKDIRKNVQREFIELPEQYRGRYRYWDGSPLQANELICPVCNIIIIAMRDFKAGDKVYCRTCGTRMIVIEKEGGLVAEPVYSKEALARFYVTENLQGE